MNKFRNYIVIIVFAFSLSSFSQNSDAPLLLEQILKTIEVKFDVKFSYADQLVKAQRLKAPDRSLNLEETLNYLERETKLKFVVLNSRFIAIKQNITENITPKLQQLEEIIIQNYLTSGLAKSINGTIEISPQKFGILPGLSEPDILQTIQALPGIKSADERISNINIRGGTNDQNLILYEGIRMYQTGHFFGLISAFNPYLTNNVDVTINGTRAKYGSGVSSLISIENSNEISKKPESGAGFNLLSLDGFSKFQLSKKTELQVAGRRSYTDALLTPTYDTYFERIFSTSELGDYQNPQEQLQRNERFFFYDANVKLLYDINKKSKLRGNAITIFNKLDYGVESLLPFSTLESTQSQLSQKSYAANIRYTFNWSPSLLMEAQIYYSNYELFGNNKVLETTQELTQENEVTDIGARLDVLKTIDNNLNLNYGYQFNEVGVSNLEDVTTPRFRSFIKEVVRTHGLYTEAEFKSNSRNTYARLGLRGNYIEDFGQLLFEPRFNFSQKFLNYFRLEVLGEVKSQTITQIIDLQQDFFGIEKRRWQLANDTDVPIVKSHQLSVGLNYRRKGWLVSAEGYIKRVNGITTRSQGFQNQFQLVSASGDYKVKGIDFLLNKRFKNLNTWIAYSLSKNDYDFESLNNGNRFPNNIDIRQVINVSASYEIENFKLSAGLNWNSGRPFTAPNSNQFSSGEIIYEAPNNKRIPNYLRTDVSARYNFQFADNVQAEVGASVWNIQNRKNTINRFFSREGTDSIVENNEIALGLTPNFSFRLKF
ncbi:outer membrane receptor protein involved in Fe transport [Winogradskyella wandonensis]|uniref:Outer membrane receptor protein involved in Fe transport n=1 Tax=Winogradskyella wandonensis TaxID=1442586 RepID=A0A4R1KTZ0_9FLAO|nr:TonB-dependent receptor plug domain-containing protein [Winogradskyella wandonensis]TCK68624.1 outer membrane receptor protein involved in Fe transport [Winogradskyella wandonensis]